MTREFHYKTGFMVTGMVAGTLLLAPDAYVSITHYQKESLGQDGVNAFCIVGIALAVSFIYMSYKNCSVKVTESELIWTNWRGRVRSVPLSQVQIHKSEAVLYSAEVWANGQRCFAISHAWSDYEELFEVLKGATLAG
jgi:hypothetical protein